MAAILDVAKYPHHEKKEVCFTRAKYRQGQKYTAVKVYTVSQESSYLLILNVPAVGVREELEALCQRFGPTHLCIPLDQYESEPFTETYLVKYCRLQAARTAKKQLDERSFFGGSLHVCYAPEFESVQDTRNKLEERRKIVAARLKQMSNPQLKYHKPRRHVQKTKVEEKSKPPKHQSPVDNNGPKSITYIWAGKEYTVSCPQTSAASNNADKEDPKRTISNTSFVPRQVVPKKMKESRTEALEEDLVLRIRKRVAAVAAANMEVTLKRRKKIK